MELLNARHPCFSLGIDNAIAHIVLNCPEAGNAMNRAFWNEFPALVREIDDKARGAGDRDFLER